MWTRAGKIMMCIKSAKDLFESHGSRDLLSKQSFSDTNFISALDDCVYALHNILFSINHYNAHEEDQIKLKETDLINKKFKVLNHYYKYLSVDYPCEVKKEHREGVREIVVDMVPPLLDSIEKSMQQIIRKNKHKGVKANL